MSPNLERVEEGAAFLVLGNEIDVAVKLVNDQLANHEAQPNAIGVQFLLLVLESAKELEQLVLVFLFDANAVVNN